MILFISLNSLFITFYWVSMTEFIPSTKIGNNTEDAQFGIPGEKLNTKSICGSIGLLIVRFFSVIYLLVFLLIL